LRWFDSPKKLEWLIICNGGSTWQGRPDDQLSIGRTLHPVLTSFITWASQPKHTSWFTRSLYTVRARSLCRRLHPHSFLIVMPIHLSPSPNCAPPPQPAYLLCRHAHASSFSVIPPTSATFHGWPYKVCSAPHSSALRTQLLLSSCSKSNNLCCSPTPRGPNPHPPLWISRAKVACQMIFGCCICYFSMLHQKISYISVTNNSHVLVDDLLCWCNKTNIVT
jgi:hypothetical protein